MFSGINTNGIVPDFMISKINYSKPVRIGWSVDDPLANDCLRDYGFNCKLPGYEAEYANTIINGILKLDVELQEFKDYDEMAEGLANKSIDIVGLSYFVDDVMASRFGWAPVYLWDGTALIAKLFDKPTDDSLLLMEAFAPDLWICMTVVTIVSLFIRYLSKKLYKERKKNNMPLSRLSYLFYVFRAKIVYVLWFLLLGILLNFYGNVFAVNILTSSKAKMRPFTDMMDLGRKLKSKECSLTIYKAYKDDNEFHGTIINPTRHNRSWAQLFREAFVSNPPTYTDDRDEMMKLVLNQSCMVALDWWTMESYFHSHWCDVEVVMYPEERDTYFQYTFYTTRMDIQDAVYTIISSPALQSFVEYLGNKYYLENSPKDCNAGNGPAVVALDISKLQDSVYVLLIGLFLATVILLYQRMKLHHSQRFDRRNQLTVDSITGSVKRRNGTIAPSQRSDISTQMTPKMEHRRVRTNYGLYY